LQRGAFLIEGFGAVLIAPDAGIGEFELYFFEALRLAVVVKDTP
jgi:hypothetical protein